MREVFQKKLKKNYLIMYLHMEGGAEKIHFFLGGRYSTFFIDGGRVIKTTCRLFWTADLT